MFAGTKNRLSGSGSMGPVSRVCGAWLALLGLLVGCSSTETPETETPEAVDRATVVAAFQSLASAELGDFHAAAVALRAAMPPVDDDGWSDATEAAAVVAMRERWREARIAYHRIWSYAAILFPDQEARIERLYDVHLNEESPAFEGMHAIERVLWADSADAAVLAAEATLSGYEAPRFPTNGASATAVAALLDDLVEISESMRSQLDSRALEPGLAAFGLQKTVEKILKKVSPPLGLFDSRYARHTLAELRANADGIEAGWAVVRPVVLAAGDAAADAAVSAGLERLRAALGAVEQLPEPPDGWNPSIVNPPPGTGSYQTLWAALRAEVDLTDGTLSWGIARGVTLVQALPAWTPPAGLELVGGDPGFPVVAGVDDSWRAIFDRGQREFDATFTEADGLGPVYIEASCSTCHFDSAAEERTTVEKMTRLDGDMIAADQSVFTCGRTVRKRTAAGASQPVAAPAGETIFTAYRASPGLFGRGWMEAVSDDEIERIEAEQATRSDGISGRIHRVTWTAEANPETTFHGYVKGQSGLIGRFGLKAHIATLDDFISTAYLTDMSITTPLRPEELCNPDGLTDDNLDGVDLPLNRLNDVADWTRLIDIPERETADPRGAELFTTLACAVCHVPSMRTRADYPIEPMADQLAWIYSDLLLHDMGPDFSDGVQESDASPTEWRTAPLIALARMPTYLHDGRATTLHDAIQWHAGEAAASAAAYLALSEADRAALLDFVSSL